MSAPAVLLWVFTFAFGWLWWCYLKSGIAHSRAGKSTRKGDPFNYWFVIVTLGVSVIAMGVFAVWSRWWTGNPIGKSKLDHYPGSR